MSRFVSSRNPVSANALKRKPKGCVVVHHYGRVDVKFTRRAGGWVREVSTGSRVDLVVVPSASVADECNKAVGCKESWAKVY